MRPHGEPRGSRATTHCPERCRFPLGLPGVGVRTLPAARLPLSGSNSQPGFPIISECCRAPGSLPLRPHPISLTPSPSPRLPAGTIISFHVGPHGCSSFGCASLPPCQAQRPPGAESKSTSTACDASLGVLLPRCENAGPLITYLP